jgi:hypothetical protein
LRATILNQLRVLRIALAFGISLMFLYIRIVLLFGTILLAGCVAGDKTPQQSSKDKESAEFDAAIAAMNAKKPILSDEILIRKFQRNRSTFEELRQMIVADSQLYRVDDDWTDPSNTATVGVSPKRIAEYRRLLAEVGCGRGFAHYPGVPGVEFISGTKGLAIAGESKGYCYFDSPPASVVMNTATYKPANNDEDYKVFRPIEGHWYIYFESF